MTEPYRTPLPVYGETDRSTLRPGLYLALFHGRKDPNEVLDDWGTNGPMFGPLNFVHTTYANDLKFEFEDAADWARAFPSEPAIYGYRLSTLWRDLPGCIAPTVDQLRADPALGSHPAVGALLYQTHGWLSIRTDGLIEFEGCFYGDWSVFNVPAPPPQTVTLTPIART